MTKAFRSLAGFGFARHACAGLAVALIVCVPRVAEAGVQNIPCKSPFVFKSAAVNVVILPYESAQALPDATGLGDKLSVLMQMEVLRSIAKFGSVGAVQMVGSAAECNPDLVIAKLLGRTPGASATVAKGQGLIVVWGRFYNQGGDVFVQTYCRFMRSGLEETLDASMGGRQFSAVISAPVFACASWKVTVADLRNFEDQFRRSTILRVKPEETASGSPLPTQPLPYWISDTQGDWMKISVQNGPQGWIRLSGARDSWSLARWLPELKYIEGIAGYLRVRIAAQQPTTVRPEWIVSAAQAFSDYEASVAAFGKDGTAGPAAALRNALAGAVQLQLRAILSALKPGATVDERVSAMKLLERAEAMLPADGNARNLRAVVQVSLAGSGYPGVPLKQTAEDLLRAVGADPGNARLLANLESAYEVLLAQATPPLTDAERAGIGERLAAIKQIRMAKRDPR